MDIDMKKNSSPSRKKGFTLLIAVLVSSVFLSLASTIATITFKQIILSSIGKDSQLAFYAADAGMECALYWDLKFSDSSAGPPIGVNGSAFPVANNDDGIGGAGEVFCNEQDIVVGNGSSYNFAWSLVGIDGVTQTEDGNEDYRRFGISLGTQESDPCVVVEVRKKKTGTPQTVITSHGYNTCNPSARQIERALEATFE